MKILQRYVFKELLLPFALSLIVLNFIFMGGYLVKAANFIIGKGIPLSDTLYVLVLALPTMVGYTVPTSILLAVLIVFGAFSQNNELRAMKASGVHLLKVVVPAFALGLFLSLLMFMFNDQIVSNARFELRRTMKKMIIKYPKALIEPGRFVKLSNTVIFMTKELRDDELLDIIAYEVADNDEPVRTIIAESGEILTKEETGEIQIRLYNGSISDTAEKGVNTIQFETYEFPTFGAEDISKMRKKKKDYTMAEILIELDGGGLNDEDELELWTAFHARIAFAACSFIFVIMGIPIAVLVRRGEIVTSFGIAMATACSYYILFAGAKTLAIQEVLPPLLALWTPNMVLAGISIYLLRKSLAS